MSHRTCGECGAEFVPAHPRNTYCEKHRGRRAAKLREYHDVECVQCGTAFKSARRSGKLCSEACRSTWYRQVGYGPPRQTVCRLPSEHPVRRRMAEQARQRTPLRTAMEAGDRAGIIAAIKLDTIENENGCWIWQRRVKDGYAVVRVDGRTLAAHRLVLEAKHGASLGKQAAHHICATPACVAPHHLQPVTARDNTAEMLARTYMVSRIADLEAALAALAPHHPLLDEIGLAAA